MVLTMVEGVKEELDSGFYKMRDISEGGGQGFPISEKDPKELYRSLVKDIRFIKFDVKPMPSINEMIAVIKEMQQ